MAEISSAGIKHFWGKAPKTRVTVMPNSSRFSISKEVPMVEAVVPGSKKLLGRPFGLSTCPQMAPARSNHCWV